MSATAFIVLSLAFYLAWALAIDGARTLLDVLERLVLGRRRASLGAPGARLLAVEATTGVCRAKKGEADASKLHAGLVRARAGQRRHPSVLPTVRAARRGTC
jgi:hypothetical protein